MNLISLYSLSYRSFQSVRHAPLLDALSHISFLTPLASPDVTHLSKSIGKPQSAQPSTSCRSSTDTMVRHFNFSSPDDSVNKTFDSSTFPPQHAHDPSWSHSTTLIIDFPMTVRRLSLVCRLKPQSHELHHPVDIILQRPDAYILLVLLLRQLFQRLDLVASKVHEVASVGTNRAANRFVFKVGSCERSKVVVLLQGFEATLPSDLALACISQSSPCDGEIVDVVLSLPARRVVADNSSACW
ncbi:hypothetical protein FMUND_11870 [Fusarium mundagurra]|uniref:Uncharacterized protein n=1 Tax=Fusarium mundagurra TaxID=1567541 RepID=A0A8H5Y588_9HYPO|nr:hypothetical protein FMUND_11870 [Fusarium mundagurra]